ncbi:hypothetical protein ACEPAI_4197 [Sanghuangporus weigelae]
MPISAPTFSSITGSTPAPSVHSATNADGPTEELGAEIDGLIRVIVQKATRLIGWQESHNNQVLCLQEQIRALWSNITDVQRENREIIARLEDLSAAIAGDEVANIEVCKRLELRRHRDSIVQILTEGTFLTWETYANSFPEDSHPSEARDHLLQIAKEVIPVYEERAILPPPISVRPKIWTRPKIWKKFVKNRAKGYGARRESEMDKTEYANRMCEALEAQRVLELLEDEEIWELFK